MVSQEHYFHYADHQADITYPSLVILLILIADLVQGLTSITKHNRVHTIPKGYKAQYGAHIQLKLFHIKRHTGWGN
jgi:hypothetical protein